MIEVACKRIFRQARDEIINREYHTMERGGNRANILALKYGLSRIQVLNIAKLAA